MNKSRYRKIFSKRLGTLVPVAECTHSEGKQPGQDGASTSTPAPAPDADSGWTSVVSCIKQSALAVTLLLCASTFAQAIPALPTGGAVAGGQAAITQPNGNTLNIDQRSQRAVINWNSFDIAKGNTVRFNQPNAQAAALNMVGGGRMSNIQGALLANGQVLIYNANGVLFGANAQVNVGSLLATTKQIDPAAFMSGGPLSLNPTGTRAGVINEGTITAAGYVTLMGDQVRNSGNIAAGGKVVLAAGDKATVALANGQGIEVKLTQATANALVQNDGAIRSQNGAVLLTARGSNTLLDTVINLSGVVKAATVVADAGQSGDVVVTGKADASNTAPGGAGGTVVLSGNRVGLFGQASIDASGNAKGGTVIVGGDRLKQLPGTSAAGLINEVALADRVQVDAGARINAGAANGKGGFVETSGRSLHVQGQVKGGDWLIDPLDVTISTAPDANLVPTGAASPSSKFIPANTPATVNNKTISNALSGGTNVTVTTLGTIGPEAGNITQNADADIFSSSKANLKLEAVGDVRLNGNIKLSGGGLNLTADAENRGQGSVIQAATSSIALGGGKLAVSGNTTKRAATDAVSLGGNLRDVGEGTITGKASDGAGVSLLESGTLDVTGNLVINGSSNNLGVYLLGGASVANSGASLTVMGQSLNGGVGVYQNIGSTLKVLNGGKVALDGMSDGGYGHGVLLWGNTTVANAGSSLNVQGTTSSDGVGTDQSGALSVTGGGNVMLYGSSNDSYGVILRGDLSVANAGSNLAVGGKTPGKSSGTLQNIGSTLNVTDGGAVALSGLAYSGGGVTLSGFTHVTDAGSSLTVGGEALKSDAAGVNKSNGSILVVEHGGNVVFDGTAYNGDGVILRGTTVLSDTGSSLSISGKSEGGVGIRQQAIIEPPAPEGGIIAKPYPIDNWSTLDVTNGATVALNGKSGASDGVILGGTTTVAEAGSSLTVNGAALGDGAGIHQVDSNVLKVRGGGNAMLYGSSEGSYNDGVILGGTSTVLNAGSGLTVNGATRGDRFGVSQSGMLSVTDGGTATIDGTADGFSGFGVSLWGTLSVAGVGSGLVVNGYSQGEGPGVFQSIGSTLKVTAGGNAGLYGKSYAGGGVTLAGSTSVADAGKLLVIGSTLSGSAGVIKSNGSTLAVTSGGTVELDGVGDIGDGVILRGSTFVADAGSSLIVSGVSNSGFGIRQEAVIEPQPPEGGISAKPYLIDNWSTLDVINGATAALGGTSVTNVGVSLSGTTTVADAGSSLKVGAASLKGNTGITQAADGVLSVVHGGAVALDGWAGGDYSSPVSLWGSTSVAGAGSSLTVNGQTQGNGTGISTAGALNVMAGGNVTLNGWSNGSYGQGVTLGGNTWVEGAGSSLTVNGQSLGDGVGVAIPGPLNVTAGGTVGIYGVSSTSSGVEQSGAFTVTAGGNAKLAGWSDSGNGVTLWQGGIISVSDAGSELTITGTSNSGFGVSQQRSYWYPYLVAYDNTQAADTGASNNTNTADAPQKDASLIPLPPPISIPSTLVVTSGGTATLNGTSNINHGVHLSGETTVAGKGSRLTVNGQSMDSGMGICQDAGSLYVMDRGSVAFYGNTYGGYGYGVSLWGTVSVAGLGSNLAVIGQSVNDGIGIFNGGTLNVTSDGFVLLNGSSNGSYGVGLWGSTWVAGASSTLQVNGQSQGSEKGIASGGALNVTSSGNVALNGVSNTGSGVEQSGALNVTTGGNVTIYGKSDDGTGVSLRGWGTTLVADAGSKLTITGESNNGIGLSQEVSSPYVVIPLFAKAKADAGVSKDIAGVSKPDVQVDALPPSPTDPNLVRNTLDVINGGTATLNGTSNASVGVSLSGTTRVTGIGSSLLIGGESKLSTGVDQSSYGTLSVTAGGNATLYGLAGDYCDCNYGYRYGVSLLGSMSVADAGSSLEINGKSLGDGVGVSSSGALNVTAGGNMVINGLSHGSYGFGVGLWGSTSVADAGSSLTVNGESFGDGTGVVGAGVLNVTASGNLALNGVSNTGSGVEQSGALNVTAGGTAALDGRSDGGNGVILRGWGSILVADAGSKLTISGESNNGIGVSQEGAYLHVMVNDMQAADTSSNPALTGAPNNTLALPQGDASILPISPPISLPTPIPIQHTLLVMNGGAATITGSSDTSDGVSLSGNMKAAGAGSSLTVIGESHGFDGRGIYQGENGTLSVTSGGIGWLNGASSKGIGVALYGATFVEGEGSRLTIDGMSQGPSGTGTHSAGIGVYQDSASALNVTSGGTLTLAGGAYNADGVSLWGAKSVAGAGSSLVIRGQSLDSGSGVSSIGTLNVTGGGSAAFEGVSHGSYGGGVALFDDTFVANAGSSLMVSGESQSSFAGVYYAGHVLSVADGGNVTINGAGSNEGVRLANGDLSVDGHGSNLSISGASLSSDYGAGIQQDYVSTLKVTNGGTATLNGKSASDSGVNLQGALSVAGAGSSLKISGKSGSGVGVVQRGGNSLSVADAGAVAIEGATDSNVGVELLGSLIGSGASTIGIMGNGGKTGVGVDWDGLIALADAAALKVSGASINGNGLELDGKLNSTSSVAPLISGQSVNGASIVIGAHNKSGTEEPGLGLFTLSGSQTLNLSAILDAGSTGAGIKIGNLTVTDKATLNVKGGTDTGTGVGITGEVITTGNGALNITGNANGKGTGVDIAKGSSIKTSVNGATRITGTSNGGTGVKVGGALSAAGDGSVTIIGNGGDKGTGVDLSGSSSIETSGNGVVNIDDINKGGKGAVAAMAI